MNESETDCNRQDQILSSASQHQVNGVNYISLYRGKIAEQYSNANSSFFYGRSYSKKTENNNISCKHQVTDILLETYDMHLFLSILIS